MDLDAEMVGAFACALVVTGLLTEPARRLAIRTQFFDHPVGYKKHRNPTPYLGGVAVVAGFLVAAVVFADAVTNFPVILLGCLSLFAVGTLDDRVGLGIAPRLAVQCAGALALWLADGTGQMQGAFGLVLTLV